MEENHREEPIRKEYVMEAPLPTPHYFSQPPPTILSPERPLPSADELQKLVADLTALVQQLLKK